MTIGERAVAFDVEYFAHELAWPGDRNGLNNQSGLYYVRLGLLITNRTASWRQWGGLK